MMQPTGNEYLPLMERLLSIRGFAASEDETQEWSIVQDLGANED